MPWRREVLPGSCSFAGILCGREQNQAWGRVPQPGILPAPRLGPSDRASFGSHLSHSVPGQNRQEISRMLLPRPGNALLLPLTAHPLRFNSDGTSSRKPSGLRPSVFLLSVGL